MLLLDHLWILLALPLAGAAANGLFGRYWSKRTVDAVAVGASGLTFAAALELWREFAQLPAAALPWVRSYFPWIVAGEFRADFALQVDQLTLVMVLVVTGVSWLIHIYSTGYMAGDTGYARFFAYLNLFLFFMLLLVLAANYPLLFVGWEGVGLSSYLLIGFWFLRKSAADAGKKAFIVNRIGDFGFLLGIFLLYWTFSATDFRSVFAAVGPLPVETEAGVLTAIGLLLLAGAIGKSAQFPLYVWLPDAMEGPTPVSALIHAATMVTAGVYVVARSAVIFVHAPLAQDAVAVIGCLTAVYAATIGLVQTDIKRVLAYSTISQLGNMFLACGVGAFAAGIFHLMTHAFFKALLFLAAGSVIHALGGEQDIRHMGGLSRRIPWTYGTMLVATLAISGAPLFSGFFSKDAILFAAYASGHRLLWGLGTLGAVLTAFYMFRLIFLVFHGRPRFNEQAVHVHESPRVMIVPLVVLAVLSVVGGWLAAPKLWGGADLLERFLTPVLEAPAWLVGFTGEELHALELRLSGAAVLAAALGFLAAWWLYLRQPEKPAMLAVRYAAPYQLLLNKYYVDELYAAAVVRPLLWFSERVLWKKVDIAVIDGAANGAAQTTRRLGEQLRRMQSGNARSYAAWVILGAAIVTVALVWWVQ